MRLLCSTGAFSRDPDLTGHQAIGRYGPRLPVDGLEVMFYPDWYGRVGSIASDLSASGLSLPVVHAEKSIGPLLGTGEHIDRALALERLDVNCRFAQEVGAELIVLHLWGLPGSDEHFDCNLGALADCLDVAEAHGVGLAIETVPCSKADPLTNTRLAIERDKRCLVALDIEFLALHGQLEEALASDAIWDEGRIRHMHIKDYDGRMVSEDGRRRYLHPGEGIIDFGYLFHTLAARGYNGTISLESSAVSPQGAVGLDKLRQSLDLLGKLIEGSNNQK